MRGYTAKKGSRYYSVIYEGVDPATGKERRRWCSGGPRKADTACPVRCVSSARRLSGAAPSRSEPTRTSCPERELARRTRAGWRTTGGRARRSSASSPTSSAESAVADELRASSGWLARTVVLRWLGDALEEESHPTRQLVWVQRAFADQPGSPSQSKPDPAVPTQPEVRGPVRRAHPHAVHLASVAGDGSPSERDAPAPSTLARRAGSRHPADALGQVVAARRRSRHDVVVAFSEPERAVVAWLASSSPEQPSEAERASVAGRTNRLGN